MVSDISRTDQETQLLYVGEEVTTIKVDTCHQIPSLEKRCLNGQRAIAGTHESRVQSSQGSIFRVTVEWPKNIHMLQYAPSPIARPSEST